MLNQVIGCFCQTTSLWGIKIMCFVAWRAAYGLISAVEAEGNPVSSRGNQACSEALSVPPRVAESRRWVPYFLIRLSVIIWRVGRLPSWRMVCIRSGSRGKARPPLPPKLSRFSTARLFTFHRPNSLRKKTQR